MPIRWFGIPLLLTAALGLAACSKAEAPSLNECQPGAPPSACRNVIPNSGSNNGVKGFQSSESSDDNSSGLSWIFDFNHHGSHNGGSSMAVNAFLWRGALDTLSFMPLASADPFGGVIITDWYTPPSSPDERFKATAFILGRELRTNNLRVSIFRQVLQDGHWVDAQVSPTTVNDIEDKVLARARQLRIEAKGSNS